MSFSDAKKTRIFFTNDIKCDRKPMIGNALKTRTGFQRFVTNIFFYFLEINIYNNKDSL